MGRLFEFLIKYGNVFLFFFLLFISLVLIVNVNRHQQQVYEEVTLSFTGELREIEKNIKGYFELRVQNDKLVEENIQLRQRMVVLENEVNTYKYRVPYEKNFMIIPDSLRTPPGFSFLQCRAINNTTNKNYNYITLDKGTRQGVVKGMGILSPEGIAGMVVSVSQNYSLGMSVLNRNFKVSAKILSNNYSGSLVWEDNDPMYASVKYIPLHLKLEKGDTVVTSGYSTVFPEGFMIGTIENFGLNKEDGFYEVQVKLATQFGTLENLYLVRHEFREELDTLEVSAIRE